MDQKFILFRIVRQKIGLFMMPAFSVTLQMGLEP